MEKNNQLLWPDYMRVAATFCVVLLHTAAPLLYQFNELPKMYWHIGNFYDSTVRMCVPLFFMLSGYLLLEKNEPWTVFYRKRLVKVVIPFLVWSLFYIFWKDFFEGSESVSLRSFSNAAFTPAYYHLWFPYALIAIYLFLPILRVMVQRSGTALLYGYIAGWFLIITILPFAGAEDAFTNKMSLLSIAGFAGYLVLGLILGRMTVGKRAAILAGIISMICIFVTVFGTYWLTVQNQGEFSGYFYNYLSPNVVILASGIFILIKYIVANAPVLASSRLAALILSISSASLGIYFIHAAFLYMLEKGSFGLSLSGFTGHAVYSIPLTAMATFLLSYIFVLILKQIPVVNRVVP